MAMAKITDDRFSTALVRDVQAAIEAHGYDPFNEAQMVELRLHLAHLLHGEPDEQCQGGVA